MDQIQFGVITISDRSFRGEREDLSGPALQSKIKEQKWEVRQTLIIEDDYETIRQTLIDWAESGLHDVILTTGGTGFGIRDVTPEATLNAIERAAPGLTEAMRSESLKVTNHAMLSRAAAGIRARTLIVNLPGSPKGAVENLEIIIPVLPHAVQLLKDSPDSEKTH